MNLPALYMELETLADRMGLEILEDIGSFRGGLCRFNGEEVVVLNKSATLAQRARLLGEILAVRELADIYIKPGIRSVLDKYKMTDLD